MIRFIRIDDQITQDGKGTDFSFYNTVTDRFIELDGYQVWSSWEEFVKDYEDSEEKPYPLERFEGLFSRKSR